MSRVRRAHTIRVIRTVHAIVTTETWDAGRGAVASRVTLAEGVEAVNSTCKVRERVTGRRMELKRGMELVMGPGGANASKAHANRRCGRAAAALQGGG